MLLDMLLGHKANTALPANRRVVEDIDGLEPFPVLLNQTLEIIPEKDILLINIGVDQSDSCAIGRVFKGSANDLQHGRNSGSASNHREVGHQVGSVVKLSLGPFDADLVTELEQRDMFRDIAFLVCLLGRVHGEVSGLAARRCWKLNLP